MSTAYTPKATLRLVVSKLLRAEKLYSSLKQQSTPTVGRAPIQQSRAEGLDRAAHEVQSEQWQLVFSEARKSLQELLNQPLPPSVIMDRSRALRDRCIALSEVAQGAVEKEISKLVYNIRAHEFISVASGALHLAKLKARAQAYAAVVEELKVLAPGARRDGFKVRGAEAAELKVVGERAAQVVHSRAPLSISDRFPADRLPATQNPIGEEHRLRDAALSANENTGQEINGVSRVIEFAPRRAARM